MSSSSASLLPSPPPRRHSRPTVYSPSGKTKEEKESGEKKGSVKDMYKEQIERCMSLREALNVFSHAEVANFLLDL